MGSDKDEATKKSQAKIEKSVLKLKGWKGDHRWEMLTVTDGRERILCDEDLTESSVVSTHSSPHPRDVARRAYILCTTQQMQRDKVHRGIAVPALSTKGRLRVSSVTWNEEKKKTVVMIN